MPDMWERARMRHESTPVPEELEFAVCLEFYQLKEKLAVGKIVNMLDIVERQAKATKVVKP